MSITSGLEREEREATERLRRRYPYLGQRTFATIVKNRSFHLLPGRNELSPDDKQQVLTDLETAHNAPKATIYGRIRRIDKQIIADAEAEAGLARCEAHEAKLAAGV